MKRIIIISSVCLMMLSCGDEFLEVKPDKGLVVPTTFQDLRSLLDNDRNVFNQDAGITFIGTDNYYIQDEVWQSLYSSVERQGYIWAADVFQGEDNTDWITLYEQVFYSNVVLDRLEEIAITENSREREDLKGSALFLRSMAFYNLAQAFAPPYVPGETAGKLGIPLRLTADINPPVVRNSLQETYDEIINSLKLSLELLPEDAAYKTRPDKAAAAGLLARVYLSIQDYMNAEKYADMCLGYQSTLMDYNDYDAAATAPFDIFNDEVIYHSNLILYNIAFNHSRIDPEFYDSYQTGDLRKDLFFALKNDNSISFKGFYSHSFAFLFSGLAVDELYLIRAESRVRNGDIKGALEDFNTLMEKRWEAESFTPYESSDQDEVLSRILTERRKELLFRGLRWTDLRRLNQEPAFAETLTRELNGEVYVLPPNDNRYTYPIPQKEINITGIPQNERM